MNREEARIDINGRPLTDFVQLEPSRKAGRDMYVCPICHSGEGKSGTGALHLYRDTNRVICYAGGCFTDKGEDTLGALRTIWQCTETEALERAGYILDGAPARREARKAQERKPEPLEDHTTFYRQAHEDLKASPEALDYLHSRGITDASIERFNLGYCANWKHSKAGARVPGTRRIIIPRTAHTYTARRIDKPANPFEEKYVKQVEGRQKDLFNLEALEGAETPFICEGELDAISLYQAGASNVIAIGTTTNAGTILEAAKRYPDAVYILALDNDPAKEDGTQPGKDAQRKLSEAMKEAGLMCLDFEPEDVYNASKDANEAFLNEREYLESAVSGLETIAKTVKATRDEERRADLRKRTGEGMLEDFLLQVKQRDFEPIATGISDLDRALEGGFVRKTLVLLGAAPGAGKTALAQWILENMARAGHDALFLNLEMDRSQLLARSLSRIAWKNEPDKKHKQGVSALDVLRGYAWSEAQAEAIGKAAEEYGRDVAPHIIYNPDALTNSIDSILSAMYAETMRIKAQGRPAPLICVDYLQLIDSGERDAVEGLKNVIARLKTFAIEQDTVVLCITAHNRASNRAGTAEMESGRDTSAIEYSGDMMLGLAYTAIEDHRKYTYTTKSGEERTKEYTLEKIRELRKKAYEEGKPVPSVCNEVSLKVLKNRFGEAERRANLIFDGRHSTFTLKAHKWQEEATGDEWENILNEEGWH